MSTLTDERDHFVILNVATDHVHVAEGLTQYRFAEMSLMWKDAFEAYPVAVQSAHLACGCSVKGDGFGDLEFVFSLILNLTLLLKGSHATNPLSSRHLIVFPPLTLFLHPSSPLSNEFFLTIKFMQLSYFILLLCLLHIISLTPLLIESCIYKVAEKENTSNDRIYN